MEKISIYFKKGYDEVYIRMPNFKKGASKPIVCKNGIQIVDEFKKAFPGQPEIVNGILISVLDLFESIKSNRNTSVDADIYLDGFANGIYNSLGEFDQDFPHCAEAIEEDYMMTFFSIPDGNDDINDSHFGQCAIILNYRNNINICRTPEILLRTFEYYLQNDKLEVIQYLYQTMNWLKTEDDDLLYGAPTLWYNALSEIINKY